MRERIVAVARSWLGTPFHDCARLKGVGTDCAGFVAEVYRESGAVPDVVVPAYAPQWFLHQSRELLSEHVLRYARPIDEAAAQAGDLVLYRIGHCYAHAAIVVAWPGEIVHAHKGSGCVLIMGGREADLRGRAVRFFTVGRG